MWIDCGGRLVPRRRFLFNLSLTKPRIPPIRGAFSCVSPGCVKRLSSFAAKLCRSCQDPHPKSTVPITSQSEPLAPWVIGRAMGWCWNVAKAGGRASLLVAVCEITPRLLPEMWKSRLEKTTQQSAHKFVVFCKSYQIAHSSKLVINRSSAVRTSSPGDDQKALYGFLTGSRALRIGPGVRGVLRATYAGRERL